MPSARPSSAASNKNEEQAPASARRAVPLKPTPVPGLTNALNAIGKLRGKLRSKIRSKLRGKLQSLNALLSPILSHFYMISSLLST